jgi:hypothetical protein
MKSGPMPRHGGCFRNCKELQEMFLAQTRTLFYALIDSVEVFDTSKASKKKEKKKKERSSPNPTQRNICFAQCLPDWCR